MEDVLCEIFGQNAVDPALFGMAGPSGDYLLHVVARSYCFEPDPNSTQSPRSQLTNLLFQPAISGANPHGLNAEQKTPFSTMICSTWRFRELEHVRQIMQRWLQTLERAGVDLERYGLMEQQCLQKAADFYPGKEFEQEQRHIGVLTPKYGRHSSD